jgi:hypothetical protein
MLKPNTLPPGPSSLVNAVRAEQPTQEDDMIQDDLIRHHLDEHRRDVRDRVEMNRLLAAARAGRPRPLAAIRAAAGMRVARLGFWLAGPAPAAVRSGQRS